MPAISVIVPVYQGESCLEGCVRSVLGQDFSDWELVIVDDCSTDATPEVCQRLAEEDGRVRIFRQARNAGVSEARNRGMREARGETIFFLDNDDALLPGALGAMWKLRQDAGADTAACAHIAATPEGAETVELTLPAGVYGPEGILDGIVCPLVGDRLGGGAFNGFIWRYLFDAALLREHGIVFEGAYLEDELFLIEYFCHAQKLAVTETPYYRYLLNPQSVTHRYMARYGEVFARFLERKEELVARFGLAEKRPGWRENTLWAGLLIGVGNEYARGSDKSLRERQKAVEAMCAQPQMAKAIRELEPQGLGRNKALVAKLVRGRHFFLLSMMYKIKNRI